MPKINLNEFNTPNTLAIISPYLEKGENFRGYSIGRYTKLLTESFPKDQKVVVFCDLQMGNRPHKVSKNVLLIPSYRINSFSFLINLVGNIWKFNRVKDFLIQFEFSIFGGKIVIFQIPFLLSALKFLGKKTHITLHQVVTDLGTLSGHLAIKKGSIKTRILNVGLNIFYKLTGLLVDGVFVHNQALKERISRFIDARKVRVIPHGTFAFKRFTRKFESSSKAYFGVKKDYKLIGAFGFCSWYKGTDWVIENFAKFTRENPNIKARLLVAGGESPTLKGTFAYKVYHKKLMKIIKDANGNIVYTGFVPEKDVEKVFAASDLMVFPYRTKMSASGAFSLCLGYGRPFLASKKFIESENGLSGHSFNLNYRSFQKALKKSLAGNGEVKVDLSDRSWANVANMYLDQMLQRIETEPKLEYAEVI